jgi:FMN-dependent NADH-azoreductase
VLWNANGTEGVVRDEKVAVLTSRGGSFRPGSPPAECHHQEPYLPHILGFIGLHDVTFIHAENQEPGEQAEGWRSAAIEQLQRTAALINRHRAEPPLEV